MSKTVARAHSGDHGGLSIMVAIMMVAIILLMGLTVDGGGKMRADSQADAYAQEAARAAGQMIDPTQAIPGDAIVVEPGAAKDTADRYLKSQGVDGFARVTPDGRSIEVWVTLDYKTKVAAFFGATTISVKGYARAGLVHGIRNPEDAP
ncbi:pilus assembly protein TadG-related protein [Embleya sp. NBC_00896]|uniref:pilus assembly protein TadG-related protein n=1 Tax=Embleya sp. NBC_00896 TaxID=2975961 RepID=UPI00386374C2|nr:pilus assembly protein TadG-related protein [Embleya sp. NBC_00896]